MSDMDVVSQTMRTAAAAFAKESPGLSDVVKRLRSTLDGLGEPWGNDDPGNRFGQDYKPNAESLMTAMATLSTALSSIGDGLGRMASNYDGSDVASTIPGS
ncbi:MAG: WXG100 family type VII secretion target [Pseudonocardiaceae bacterium]